MGVSQDFNLLGEKISELVPSIDIRYKISMLYLGKNYYARLMIIFHTSKNSFLYCIYINNEDWSTDYLNDDIHGKLNGLNLNSCLGYTSNIYYQKPILV